MLITLLLPTSGQALVLGHDVVDHAKEIRQRIGASLADVSGLVWTEAGIGLAYAAAGFGLFRILERESRRSAVLDAY